MGKKEKFGFLRLAKKSFAVLTASLSTILNNQGQAQLSAINPEEANKNLNFETSQKNKSKPKLVLKLSPRNLEKHFITMHTSHASHASHSSHSSHYSSSPTYTQPTSIPNYPKSNPVYIPSIPTYTPPKTITTSNNNKTLTFHLLGSRTLYLGCEGTDVKELQQLLIILEYNISVDGVFSIATEQAIKKFQGDNSLIVTGKVGKTTLKEIQKEAKTQ